MKEQYTQIFMIDTDPDMVEDIWSAIDEFEDFELPNLKLEIWKDETIGEWTWDILEKGKKNQYYDKEPDSLAVVHMSPEFLEYDNPKIQAFLYVYKSIDLIVKKNEGIIG